jgi:hypothetical protein
VVLVVRVGAEVLQSRVAGVMHSSSADSSSGWWLWWWCWWCWVVAGDGGGGGLLPGAPKPNACLVCRCACIA